MVRKEKDDEFLDALGTQYCPNCAIINEKMKQLEIWEKELEKRELELDNEIRYIQKK